MEFEREFIAIGQVQIRYYGIIIVAAMLVATAVAARLASRSGRDSEHVYGALTWAIIPGIILARLWYVIFPPLSEVEAGRNTAYFLENFFDLNSGAIAIWSGGLSIFGAVLGGLIGTYIYLRRNKLPIGPWLDIAAVVLPLGQAIGRWANFVNQELFGTPTDLPWAVRIPQSIAEGTGYGGLQYVAGFDGNGDPFYTFHPLFLYESLWSIAAFLILFYMYNNMKDRFKPGDFFLIYIAQYSVIRFLLEFIRIEVTMIPDTDINLAQAVTAMLFVLSVGALVIRRAGGVTEPYPGPLPQELPPEQQAAKPAESSA